VHGGEPGQAFLPAGGEADADYPGVALVGLAPDQARGLGAVGELDCAVVAQQEVVRYVADGRRLAARVALDRQQQLMLRRGEACLARPRFAPAEEFPQGAPEREQVLVIQLGERMVVRRGRVRHRRSEHDERNVGCAAPVGFPCLPAAGPAVLRMLFRGGRIAVFAQHGREQRVLAAKFGADPAERTPVRSS
jgi:hypothetical protein